MPDTVQHALESVHDHGTHEEAHHGDDHGHHGPPLAHYLAVFLALLVGTALTIWVAYVDLGPWNTPVALAIAITKATLVILIFMHVKYGSRLVMVMVGSAFFWLFHMIVGTVADYMSRGYLGTPGS
jgi:cytochrome c oxidase subunit IV